jgi:hypothetical protein
MRMTDVTGKAQTVVVRNVYYEPTLTYNLVSVSDMMRSQYNSTFLGCGSTLEGPAGKFALTRTSDVYALPVDNVDKPCAMGAMGRMTEEELAHLRFNHCISAHKLAILSNSGARGIIKGLKAEDWKCQIYQHEHQTLARGARRHWFRPIRYEFRSHRHDIHPHYRRHAVLHDILGTENSLRIHILA